MPHSQPSLAATVGCLGGTDGGTGTAQKQGAAVALNQALRKRPCPSPQTEGVGDDNDDDGAAGGKRREKVAGAASEEAAAAGLRSTSEAAVAAVATEGGRPSEATGSGGVEDASAAAASAGPEGVASDEPGGGGGGGGCSPRPAPGGPPKQQRRDGPPAEQKARAKPSKGRATAAAAGLSLKQTTLTPFFRATGTAVSRGGVGACGKAAAILMVDLSRPSPAPEEGPAAPAAGTAPEAPRAAAVRGGGRGGSGGVGGSSSHCALSQEQRQQQMLQGPAGSRYSYYIALTSVGAAVTDKLKVRKAVQAIHVVPWAGWAVRNFDGWERRHRPQPLGMAAALSTHQAVGSTLLCRFSGGGSLTAAI